MKSIAIAHDGPKGTLPADPQTALALYKAGWSIGAIARELLIERLDAYKLLSGEPLDYFVVLGHRITYSGIKCRLNMGFSHKDLAKSYKLPVSCIPFILEEYERREHEISIRI